MFVLFIILEAEKKNLSLLESYLHLSNPLLVAHSTQDLRLSHLMRIEELHECRPHSIAVPEPLADVSPIVAHYLVLHALVVSLYLVSHRKF